MPAPSPPSCHAVTFNVLLETCTKHNDEERAAEIMGRMLVAGGWAGAQRTSFVAPASPA